MRRLSLVLVAVTVCAMTARAQTVDLPVQNNVLSINPFGFLLEWYNFEYERAFNSTASWSIGVGNVNIGDDEDDEEFDYTSADMRLRYYPSAEAPTKFSAGISFGYSHVNVDDRRGDTPLEREFDALSVGFDLGYSWLLGRTRQFFIGTGIGAKRLFPVGGDDEEETHGYPTFRLSIGYAF